MKMNNKVLRQKILEVFGTMQERFRNTKPAITLIDALAITNQGYSYILSDLEEQDKELRQIYKFATKYKLPSDYPRDAKLIEKLLGEEK